MKQHFCPVEKTLLSFEDQCNWCGEKEESMTYNEWWNKVGSGMQPLPNEDIEEFAHRMTALAWFNGENSEREACAKVCESEWGKGYRDDGGDAWLTHDNAVHACAAAIRAREVKHE